jgi:hypothetical protein
LQDILRRVEAAAVYNSKRKRILKPGKSSGLEQLIEDAGPALKELTMSSLFRNFAVVPGYSLPLQDSSLCVGRRLLPF